MDSIWAMASIIFAKDVLCLAKMITVSNQKGGVGKTTTVNALASSLRKLGHRVLCIDFDPQGNLSFGFGAETESSASIYDVLKRELPARFAVQHTDVGDIIPANILLSGMEMEFTGRGREFLLRDAMRSVQELYDYILIDSPPGLGILTINAFAASDGMLLPLLPDIYSLQGIARISESIERVRRTCNPKLRIIGIFMTQYSDAQTLCREVRATAEMIARDLHIPMLQTTVRKSVTLAQAQALQRDVVTYSPYNSAVIDYQNLTAELLERGI